MKKVSILCILFCVLFLSSCGNKVDNVEKEQELKQEDIKVIEEVEEKKASVYFETQDINGNEVNSEEIFSKNKITMLNIWTSWCPPCIAELSELDRLNQEYSERGVEVVGLLIDAMEDGAVDVAKGLIEEKGLTYRIILSNKDMLKKFSVNSVPTTIFFDSEGCLINEVVYGANIRGYVAVLEKYLEEGE